jgi:hypothetical protein
MTSNKLVGKGRVFDRDTFIADVKYEVRIYQRRVDATHALGAAEIPGLPHLECDLSGLPRMLSFQTRFTLVLNDGRKLNFHVDGDSVRPTGGIYE